jgi:hypothetical protein
MHSCASGIAGSSTKRNGVQGSQPCFVTAVYGIAVGSMQEDGQDVDSPEQNIYIKKVGWKKLFGYDKDALWNTVIGTHLNVGQFWKCAKTEFLAAADLQPRLSALQVLRMSAMRRGDDHCGSLLPAEDKDP